MCKETLQFSQFVSFLEIILYILDFPAATNLAIPIKERENFIICLQTWNDHCFIFLWRITGSFLVYKCSQKLLEHLSWNYISVWMHRAPNALFMYCAGMPLPYLFDNIIRIMAPRDWKEGTLWTSCRLHIMFNLLKRLHAYMRPITAFTWP